MWQFSHLKGSCSYKLLSVREGMMSHTQVGLHVHANELTCALRVLGFSSPPWFLKKSQIHVQRLVGRYFIWTAMQVTLFPLDQDTHDTLRLMPKLLNTFVNFLIFICDYQGTHLHFSPYGLLMSCNAFGHLERDLITSSYHYMSIFLERIAKELEFIDYFQYLKSENEKLPVCPHGAHHGCCCGPGSCSTAPWDTGHPEMTTLMNLSASCPVAPVRSILDGNKCVWLTQTQHTHAHTHIQTHTSWGLCCTSHH